MGTEGKNPDGYIADEVDEWAEGAADRIASTGWDPDEFRASLASMAGMWGVPTAHLLGPEAARIEDDRPPADARQRIQDHADVVLGPGQLADHELDSLDRLAAVSSVATAIAAVDIVATVRASNAAITADNLAKLVPDAQRKADRSMSLRVIVDRAWGLTSPWRRYKARRWARRAGRSHSRTAPGRSRAPRAESEE